MPLSPSLPPSPPLQVSLIKAGAQPVQALLGPSSVQINQGLDLNALVMQNSLCPGTGEPCVRTPGWGWGGLRVGARAL